jgi:hypothetical protein
MKGHYKLSLDGQILISHIQGQWSGTTALRYAEEVRELVAGISAPNFAHLLCLDDWELGTPQSQFITERTVSWLVSKGMSVCAEVFSSDHLKEFILNKTTAGVKGILSVRRFDKQLDAQDWLAARGFDRNNNNSIDLEPS